MTCKIKLNGQSVIVLCSHSHIYVENLNFKKYLHSVKVSVVCTSKTDRCYRCLSVPLHNTFSIYSSCYNTLLHGSSWVVNVGEDVWAMWNVLLTCKPDLRDMQTSLHFDHRNMPGPSETDSWGNHTHRSHTLTNKQR